MDRIQCEYCNQQNEAIALECRTCGAPLTCAIDDVALRWSGRFTTTYDAKNVKETLFVTQAIQNKGLISWR